MLLVDHDVDALAELAARLRERGIRVSLANGSQMACERSKATAFDVVLASRDVAEPRGGEMGLIDVLSVELARVPPLLVLVDDDPNGETSLVRTDIEGIVGRIEQLTRQSSASAARSSVASPSLAPSAHALERGAVADLLVVLSAERRSGTLTVATAKGSGEVRLVDGSVVDAVYVRLEGAKAIGRMISEGEGSATFAPGAPAVMRRIFEDTRVLVDQAAAAARRVDELRKSNAEAFEGTLVAVEPPSASEGAASTRMPAVALDVLGRLRIPTTVDELLDDLPHPDPEVLEVVLSLLGTAKVKRLGRTSSRVQLCGADQLHLLRAAASRARAPGFEGAARVVFAATPARLAIFGHTVLSLADAIPAGEAAPSVPVPYVLASIRLGDGVALDILALPLVPAYAPMWPMALAGAAVVVRLDDAAEEALRDACSSVSVAVLDARAVFGDLDESSPVQVASLIKTALDADPR